MNRLLTFLSVSFIPIATFANPAAEPFKGFVCASSIVFHSHTDVTTLEVRRSGKIATDGSPLYDVTYTPTYQERRQTPRPELIGRDLRVREHSSQYPGLVELTTGTEMAQLIGEGVTIEASLVQTTIPRAYTVYHNSEMIFNVIRFTVPDGTLNQEKIDSREIRFHPSFCSEIQ